MRYHIARRSFAPLVRLRFWLAKFIYHHLLVVIMSNEGWQERLLAPFRAKPDNKILLLGEYSSYLALNLAARFPEAFFKAMDPNARAVAATQRRIVARKIANLRLEGLNDANPFLLTDGSCHQVVCLLSLHQRASQEKLKLLKEIARLLQRDGILHLIELDRPENDNESKMLRFAARTNRAAVISHLNGAWPESVAKAGFSRIRRQSSHSIGVGRLSVVTASNRG